MINRNPATRELHWRFSTCAVATATILSVSLLGGCGEEPEPVAVAPKRTAPPPPKPAVTPIDRLMLAHGFDERLLLPEELAPDNDDDRIAVLTFFDAFARGDEDTLGLMMSDIDRHELNELVATPAWEETVSDIKQVRIETGSAPPPMQGQKAALAIIEVGTTYQPQLWYYSKEAGDYVFEAVATPPDMMSRLYGDDFIRLWHQILEDELAYANQQDEEYEIAPISVGTSIGGGEGGGSRPPAVNPDRPSPGGPGGPPGRRKAPPKRRPPGPGGSPGGSPGGG